MHRRKRKYTFPTWTLGFASIWTKPEAYLVLFFLAGPYFTYTNSELTSWSQQVFRNIIYQFDVADMFLSKFK